MEPTSYPASGAAELEALVRRAEGIRLPPTDLPGWSSLCATEYRMIAIALAADVAGLRTALERAARAAAAG